MQRVTSRHNPRLAEAARLIASSRDRRKTGRCVLEGEHLIGVYLDRVGIPETLIVVDERLDDPRFRALAARMPARDVLAVPAAVFGEVSTLPAAVGALAVVATPRAVAAAAGRFSPAARRRAGSGQRRHHPAHGRGRGRRTGAAVEALRVCVVAQGAARRTRRAFPDDDRRGCRPRGVGARVSRTGGMSSRRWPRTAPISTPRRCAARVAIVVGNEGAGLSEALARRSRPPRHHSDARRHGVAQRGGRGGRPVVRMRASAARVAPLDHCGPLRTARPRGILRHAPEPGRSQWPSIPCAVTLRSVTTAGESVWSEHRYDAVAMPYRRPFCESVPDRVQMSFDV